MTGEGGDADEYDETRETFKAFDKSGSDKVTVSDLKSVLENLTVKLTTDELNGILAEMESVGGELAYSGEVVQLQSIACPACDWKKAMSIGIDMLMLIVE